MPAAFTACGRPLAASRRSTRRCRSAPSPRRSLRSPARLRAQLAISASRWPQCRASTRAIPGGCRRRSKVLQNRSMPRYASTPTVSIRCRKSKQQLPMPASGWSVPAGPSKKSRPHRRCARPRNGRPNCGSATATRRSLRPPNAKAIPARWPACAATGQKCSRSMRRRFRKR